MSHLLWKSYWESDVDGFRRLLGPVGSNSQNLSKSPNVNSFRSPSGHSPNVASASPRTSGKSRKTSGFSNGAGKARDASISGIGRAEINSRDHAGLTILLRAASSTDPRAQEFVQALVEHPAIDLYAQDPESGWNSLHRSLYTGNVSIARILLAKERANIVSGNVASANRVGQLIKTKDHEGNSPFDVYNSTIATRSLKKDQISDLSDSDSESEDSVDQKAQTLHRFRQVTSLPSEGDELFVFGSNRNLSLGVGDEDDRQYPERIHLTRPDHLLHRFYAHYAEARGIEEYGPMNDVSDIPILARTAPLVIQDMVMSKLHTAILTTDAVSNLYVCGVGRGGRLGLGDENTQFRFVPVQGPLADKKIRQVALGQNHTLAATANGELWTWGLNSDSQLGYILPPPIRADEEPMSLVPRQIFGSLKKEHIQGVAASSVHSVAFTSSSLYCWGRNYGQLALMDADSRSLDVQLTPRKVAASLLTAPIEMISAIDRATTCLLANCTVWVFTNYGYNLIKFPIPDFFINHNLNATSFATRYDSGRRDIRYIASGGDTIAALTARGDLFTMQVNTKLDSSQPAGSTTNPAKIKGAVSQPQCIWDSRKEGVASVGVGEHGSVIICTDSGSVWTRVERVKSKTTGFSESITAKRKDFKFQRVPYITNCVTVRSSAFGAFAALREDSHVMSQEISVAGKTLWNDIGRLCCLGDFSPTQSVGEMKGARRSWDLALARERSGSVPHAILSASDIESELTQWLFVSAFQYEDHDMAVRSSLFPAIRIPVHGWLLAARSSVLRKLIYGRDTTEVTGDRDIFILEDVEGKTMLTLQNADIFTILNLVTFAYLDTTVPVWKYTREASTLAHRFRQVRTEVMRVATRLQMSKLETAARLQSAADLSLDLDFKAAISDSLYFNGCDVLLELDGDTMPAHSQLLCERCPFFEGMFHGRSRGEWLAGRRHEGGKVEPLLVDLKHIRPSTFQLVLRYLYSDATDEVFEDIATSTLDEFSEIVLDVMAVANELMLDRLSQSCQALIGKYVTTRNVANLLNEISPCAVTDFKDVGLEYICLQLESMLENCLLDGLDEEVLLELDEIVRENQLAKLPFVRSGRAELLLHEKYPELMLDIEEERQCRVRAMAFKSSLKEEERKLSSSYKVRIGSLDEIARSPQTPDGSRRRSKAGRNEPFSPNLHPKKSQAEMIFNMDDDNTKPSSRTPPSLPVPDLAIDSDGFDLENMPALPETWRKTSKRIASNLSEAGASNLNYVETDTGQSPVHIGSLQDQPRSAMARTAAPWATSPLSTTKLDLKGIMTEASSRSALTAGLSAQAAKDSVSNKTQTKVSQKERKRQLQIQAEAQTSTQGEKTGTKPWEIVASGNKATPWGAVIPASPSLPQRNTSETSQRSALMASAKPLVASEAIRQQPRRRTASPDTRFAGQNRNLTSASPAPSSSTAIPLPKEEEQKPIVPHSKSYITPARKAEPQLGASIDDIIGQQRREQQLAKEAVAKRSLQEIQQEQAFQEWWDQESKRAQAEEARKNTKTNGDKERGKDDGGSKRNRRGNRSGKPGKGKDAASNKVKHNTTGAAVDFGSSGRTESSASRAKPPRERGCKV